MRRLFPAAPAIALLLALVVLTALRLLALLPPRPAVLPSAMATVEKLAAAPRPPGTKGHEEARDFLVRELGAMGLEVEVRRATASNMRWGVPYDVARVENIVARLRGHSRGKALALLAHYDSVPNGPGAADDASGVASVLEAARALRSGPAPRNDVLFVFTDAEEAGVLGGRAFARDPRFSEENIGLALNFDARGVSGPVALVDTSEGAGALVRHFASVAPNPLASSLFPEVARRLRHETDLRPLLDAGKRGMNFAFADGSAFYHAPADDSSHLDHASLAQMSGYAVALARRFGDLDLDALEEEELIYFDMPRLGIVAYRRIWAIPIALGASLVFLLVLVDSVRRKRARLSRVFGGFGAALLGLLAGPALAAGAVALLRALAPTFGVFRGDPAAPLFPRLALVFLGLASFATIYKIFRSKLSAEELALGALFPWFFLTLATAFVLPGGSYVFALPLAALSAGAWLWIRDDAKAKLSAKLALALLAAAIPAILVAMPVPYLLFVALGLPRAAGAVLFVVLLACAFVPELEISRGGTSAKPALALAAGFLLMLAVGVGFNRFSPSTPRPVSLAYALDADKREARWITTDKHPDVWLENHIAKTNSDGWELPGQGTIEREGPAAPLDLAAPKLELLGDVIAQGKRTLRFRLSSPRGAPFSLISVETKAAVFGGTIDGERLDEPAPFHATPSEPWGFTFQGGPAEGIEWSIDLEPGAPVSVRAVDRSYGLPEGLAHMPDDRMPMPFRFASSIFVAARYAF